MRYDFGESVFDKEDTSRRYLIHRYVGRPVGPYHHARRGKIVLHWDWLPVENVHPPGPLTKPQALALLRELRNLYPFDEPTNFRLVPAG